MPHSTALAMAMNVRLQGFNLVRIERHFNVPVAVTTYHPQISLATVSRYKSASWEVRFVNA